MCMAHVSIVTVEYLGFPHWLWFSNCLQTSNSINLDCCIKTCEYFILTKKENCQMDNYGKFGKKLLFIELGSFFIDVLAFELGKLCPGLGIFVSFFWPRGRSFALKSCPGGGDFDGKISGPAVSPGGMVTGQIDTCIAVVTSFWTSLGKALF